MTEKTVAMTLKLYERPPQTVKRTIEGVALETLCLLADKHGLPVCTTLLTRWGVPRNEHPRLVSEALDRERIDVLRYTVVEYGAVRLNVALSPAELYALQEMTKAGLDLSSRLFLELLTGLSAAACQDLYVDFLERSK